MAKSKDAAFTEWVNSRQTLLIRAARGVCFNKQLAEDILQEALTDMYKRWTKISEHENLEAYAIRVMISRHTDYRRKLRRKGHEELPLDFAENLIALDNEDEMTERLLVQNAIRALSADQRAVLLLHYNFGFTLREIGNLLQIPAGTAASHLARGKASVATYVTYLPEIVQNDKKAIALESNSIDYWDEREAN